VFLKETHRTKRPGHLFLEDKSAAFDSVTDNLISRALSRIGTPTTVINLYTDMLHSRQTQVLTAYCPSTPFHPQKGVPQGGIESPLIWLICYDIALSCLKAQSVSFSSTVLRLDPAHKIQLIVNNATPINITLTSYMDDLALFFNTRPDLISGLEMLSSYNNLVRICANPAKSVYCAFNSTNNEPITLGNQTIAPANDRQRQRLLGVYFNPSNGIKESSRHATESLCSLIKKIASKSIGPARLRYLINSVINPAIAYQFSTAPAYHPLLKRLSTHISSTTKKKLRLPKDFPTAFIFSKFAFDATGAEKTYLRKSVSDLLVALQPTSRNRKLATAFVAQLSYELCDANNSLANPIPLENCCLHHPFSHASNLLSH
jgi:Reverse transcriptase (RNA-dependent DNA polymerase)